VVESGSTGGAFWLLLFSTSKEEAMGRTAASIIITVLALSASFIAAIIVTILVTREMELTDTETDGAEA
jgi:hypothetical protein